MWNNPVPTQGVGYQETLGTVPSDQPQALLLPAGNTTSPESGRRGARSWGGGPYRAVPGRSRTAAREISAEVSSGGLAGSSFVGSLVNLFPGWRGRRRSGPRPSSLRLPVGHLGSGLWEALGGTPCVWLAPAKPGMGPG